MAGKPIVGSVVGPTNETHWGQVLIQPNAYGVVEIAYDDGGARAAGIHLLSTLGQKLADAPASLEALKHIVEDVANQGVRTVILCVPVGPVVYIVLHGGGDVYIRRGREFSRLLHNSGSISGEIKPGDFIILASAEFSHTLTQEDAGKIFDHLTPAEVAERLTLLLHERPSGEGSAAIVMQFQDDAGDLDGEPIGEKLGKPMFAKAMHEGKSLLRYFHPRRIANIRHHLSVSALKRDAERIRSHPRKATMFLAIILITLFGISVILGIAKQGFQVKNQSASAALSDARHALDEGMALMSLNPVKGRERLVQAKTLLDPYVASIPPKSVQGREIAEVYRLITDNLTGAMQIYSIKPELFFDAGLVKKGGTISHIGFEDKTMAIVDPTTTTVIALDVTSKKSTIVGGGPSYAGLSSTSIHGDHIYVLVGAGIHQARRTDNKTVQAVIPKNPEWGTIASLVAYGGNQYLLDTQKGRIWKYVATDSQTATQSAGLSSTGFTAMREYLNPDTLPDFSGATNMAIDGSVWVGTKTGKILKFTQGREDTFVPKGVEPAFGSTLLVYTSDAVKNLYILDSVNKRVVVLEKDGTYLAQYTWTDIVPIELVVSEELKKIFLLSDGKLYAITLK